MPQTDPIQEIRIRAVAETREAAEEIQVLANALKKLKGATSGMSTSFTFDMNHNTVMVGDKDDIGDLNGDGKVDIADAVTVLNIMAAGEYNAPADVNGDQKVDVADLVTILNIMAAQ